MRGTDLEEGDCLKHDGREAPCLITRKVYKDGVVGGTSMYRGEGVNGRHKQGQHVL